VEGQFGRREVVRFDLVGDGSCVDVSLRSLKKMDARSTGDHVEFVLESWQQVEAMSGNPEDAQVEQVDDLKHLG